MQCEDIVQQCTEAVVEYVYEYCKSARGAGVNRQSAIATLQQLQSHGAEWPDASVEEWNQGIDAAVKAGRLRQIGQVLYFGSDPKHEKPKPNQLQLFT